MVKNSFEWHNDWKKIQELLSKIGDVVMARDRYHALEKFDIDYYEYMNYTTVGNNSKEYDQQFAKAINKLIEEYVRDEES